MNTASPNAIYRARNGVFFGVCKGLADHFDLSVAAVRLLTVLACLFTGFWPVIGVYILMAMILKPAPVMPLASDEETEFYHSYASSRSMAVNRLHGTFTKLERRLERLEHLITAREFDWERRFRAEE